MFVATLIAPSGSPLDDTTLAGLQRAMAAIGARTDAPDWLAPEEAVDLAFAHPDTVAVEMALAQEIAQRPIDAVVQPSEGRRKRLLLADMESTVIENEMLDELAALTGIGDAVAEITRRAMNGELDFRAALEERVALFAGRPEALLEEAWARVRVVSGAATLVATMRAGGAYCALVSGGFTIYTQRVAEQLGFHEHQANRLEIADGRLTGRLLEPVLDRDAKLAALHRLTAENRLACGESLAVGDGANDLAMLGAAGLGVGFRPKPIVARTARAVVRHADLTALLYLQGYRRDEFVDTV
jgi:phosphoserine phosphatase